MSDEALSCAARILATIPMVMRSLRSGMDRNPKVELSVTQFRALMVTRHHAPAPVSLVAQHLEASLSATSKLIDGLVERQLISRDTPSTDRRQVLLTLTPTGAAMLAAVQQQGVETLAERLASLSTTELHTIEQAMECLQATFAPVSPEAEACMKP